MFPLVPAIAAAVLFYIILPTLGAFIARRRWRSFRQRIVDSSYLPLYPQRIGRKTPGDTPQPASGEPEASYRFFGILEAVEDSDIIWLSDGTHRIRVDLSSSEIYILPGHKLTDPNPSADHSPRITRWKNLGSLPEGTEFFVTGEMKRDTLVPMFVKSEKQELLVVIHDMPREQFLARAIQTGRQRNEFWNELTPFSFLSGLMAELILILSLLQANPGSLLLLALVPLALIPVMILAPPGIFLYFLYRSAWKKARKYREERDLLRLPLRYRRGEAAQGDLPDGGSYTLRLEEGLPEDLRNDGEMRIRHAMAVDPTESLVWYFSSPDSSDPFAERIYIKGDPSELARESQKRAVQLEYMSVLYFSAGLLINGLLLFALLLMWWF